LNLSFDCNETSVNYKTVILNLRVYFSDVPHTQGCSARRRGVGTPVPHQMKRKTAPNNSNKVSIRLQEFPHWIFVFTVVLRCYTRDNLSFIHLCCSRRCT